MRIPFLLTLSFVLHFACAHGTKSELEEAPLPSSLYGDFWQKNKTSHFDEPAFQTELRLEKDFWQGHHKVLFLAEGSSDWTGKWGDERLRFAENLAEIYPHLEIWAADLTPPDLRHKGVHTLAVDHRQPFPPELIRKSFDAVIGIRILCHCHRGDEAPDKMMCGGIYSHEVELMRGFLREVRSLLNPEATGAFAFIEGEYRNPKKNAWMVPPISEAQDEAAVNWSAVIRELNADKTGFDTRELPALEDPARRKAIYISQRISKQK